MLSSVKKFSLAHEFIYPYLIQTDSNGIIIKVDEAADHFLSSYNISDCLFKNVSDVFETFGQLQPSFDKNFFENNSAQTIDLFLKKENKKSTTIRWVCTPLLINEKEKRWQFTGMEITNDPEAINIKNEANTSSQKKINNNQQLDYQQIINVLNSITDGFFILDKEFKVVLWNGFAEKITGLKAGEIVGNNISEKLELLINANINNTFNKAIKNKTPVVVEQYAVKLGLWLEMNAHPYSDGLFVYFKDVTKRKKQEMLLELEKNVLEINSNQKASLNITVDYFLEGIEKIFPGMLCSVIMLYDDKITMKHLSAPSLPKNFSLAIDGAKIGPAVGSCGTAMFTQKRIIVSDITTDPLWENYKDLAEQYNLRACCSLPIISTQGDTLGTFAAYYSSAKSPGELELIILDRAANLIKIIIENKKAEEKIKIINERYILATRATNDVIWDWDMTSVTPFWSEGFYIQFGFKSGEKIDNREFWQQHLHPEDYERVVQKVEEFIAQKQTGIWLDEYRFKKADGKFVLISDRGFLVFDKDGNVVRMVGCMQDITEKRKMEKKLLTKELNKQKVIVQAVVDAQEKQSAQIGKELHDNVNQILSTTKLYLELAASDEEERLNLIARSVKNIHHAINEIRNISRSLVPPSIGDLGLLDSVHDLIESIKAIKAIHIEFYNVGPIEEKISNQQKLMLFRIIQEQVNNVLKHSEARNLIIELILAEADNSIELNIADDGKGFDPAKAKGKNGLGLSNIVNRADLFGGKVSIVSAVGEGCKLSIQVPIHNL